ncbi:hypothetical protein DSO57_1031623 [Entomophthora muscae]|uniref:Uncharacterized protein n=1 Tax=Entomophthora muscae TaxID=34485 RepID=A0ACC2TBI1_9FUNG|nr:hypothetical protein DSO57_1031623 [Entomophthora muscae]
MLSLNKKPENLTVNTSQVNILSPSISPVPGCMDSPTPSFMDRLEDSIGSPEFGWDPAFDAESDLLPSQIRALRWATSTVDFSDLCLGESEPIDELSHKEIEQIRNATSTVQISPISFELVAPFCTVDSSNDIDLTSKQSQRIQMATSQIDLTLEL